MLGNVDRAMRALLVVGGLNWLMVAAGKFDLVAVLTGRRFGNPNIATRTVYGVIGGSALYTLSRWIQHEAFSGKGADRPTGRRVRDVMTSNPRAVDASASVADAARLLRVEDVGALPVVEEGRLIGMLTDRDIVVRLLAEGKNPQSTPVGEIASRDVESAAPEQELDEALRLMARRQVRRLPVVEGQRLVGILAQADVAETAPAERTGEVVEKISR
jgi:CBS domain-containing protein/uncharacterized membrane protein YuzA (DUF378 family)